MLVSSGIQVVHFDAKLLHFDASLVPLYARLLHLVNFGAS